MATHEASFVSILTDQIGNPPRPVGITVTNLYDPGQQGYPGPMVLNLPVGGVVVSNGATFTSGGTVRTAGEVADLGFDWFEKVHIIPKRQDFGNILSQQDVTVEIFNAYREANRSLTGIAIPVTGLEFIPSPTLPQTIFEQYGLVLTLRALLDGPPSFDDVIVFTTDVRDINFAITGTRVVIFPFIPEAPIRETLAFLTDILPALNGEEQRVSLRKNPRQVFELEIYREDGAERARMENLLFDWQSRSFGLPVWHEGTRLTADVTNGDTTINVQSTAYADYRVGGLAIVLKNDLVLDALEVDSFTSTTITFTSPVGNDYDADDPDVNVYPLRVAVMRDKESGEKYQVNLTKWQFRFLVTDNRADIADAGTWNTYNSKIIFDDNNLIAGTHPQVLEKNIEVIDGETGKRVQFSSWARGKRGSMKGFLSNSRQQLWALRQILHYLRGRQVSFYLPTFQKDLVPVANLANATNNLDVTHVNYNSFVRERNPNKRIRVHLTNGTTYDRTITGSASLTSTTERLTVDTNWPTDIDVADVARIEYLQLVRFDTDQFSIEHEDANGQARLFAPVKTVFDE